MDIKTEDITQGRILRVFGKIDITSSSVLRSGLSEASKAKIPLLLIDMSEVTYLDSSGLATFLEGLKSIKEYGGKMRLVNIPDRIDKVLRLMKLDVVFDIRSSMSDAVQDS